MISLREILQKLIERLKADVELRSLVDTRIYNHVPQDEILPAMRIRTDSATEWDTKTSSGWEMSVTVDIWTDHRGDKVALQISDRVESLLHAQPLTLASGQSLLLRHVLFDSFIEPDGATHHTVMRYTHIATT